MVKPAIFILGASALPLAQQIRAALGAEIHAPSGLAGDVTYARATPHLARLFRDGRAIVGLCASGILIRAMAPHLSDKTAEPPVVAVAEDGSSAVPLLGGHHGANELARRIAAICHGHAAITTASDVRLGLAFDEPEPGLVLANAHDMKAAVAARLRGEEIAVEITERAVAGSPSKLVYHPRILAVGVGCERGTDPRELRDLVEQVFRDEGLAPQSIACYASLDLKEDEPAITQFAPVFFHTAEALAREVRRVSSPSEVVRAEVGTPSVAEAAALISAGPDSELIVAKIKSHRATMAVAKASSPLLRPHGRSRGRLDVVGLGPGAAEWRSPAAAMSLAEASDWVGYGLYLDLAADLKEAQVEHRFPLGGEEDRVRHAIDLAKQGKRVALVCSGDAGIYAMAALVYEIIDLEPTRIEVQVIAGISAFQAAASKAGAMIGHDFCCISLSDRLTPWEAIEKRVRAAAQGDFVIAFYNPRSLKRRDQLERAMAILKLHRPPQTPVVIAVKLGRKDERVKIVALADFDPDDIDMLTLVMVGSSQSKSFRRGDGRTYAYTPRGYAKKRDLT
ncbi:MAG: precorrin-3B C(17)-methyltransferase [Rhizobiales bacterium]|nr:precorrin-3B C(17)-methyltransferase [Hyphomicrobiales bacterium]